MNDTTASLLDSLAKPPPPPSELDELISRDPLDLSAQNVDDIVAYQRQQRVRKAEAGAKGKRAATTERADTKPIDLAALGLIKPKAQMVKSDPTPTASNPRPTGASFRRI